VKALADIHEHAAPLRAAMARFRLEGVDQVVVLGIVSEAGD
jgi:predicted phosphodiesterase